MSPDVKEKVQVIRKKGQNKLNKYFARWKTYVEGAQLSLKENSQLNYSDLESIPISCSDLSSIHEVPTSTSARIVSTELNESEEEAQVEEEEIG
jgi:hypothetical protein